MTHRIPTTAFLGLGLLLAGGGPVAANPPPVIRYTFNGALVEVYTAQGRPASAVQLRVRVTRNGKGVSGARIRFRAGAGGIYPWDCGTGTTDREGWANARFVIPRTAFPGRFYNYLAEVGGYQAVGWIAVVR